MATALPSRGEVVDGRFVIGATIGVGAFGVVFRAFDQQAGVDVALKALKPSAFELPDLVERFAREAQICLHLEHPNTVRIHQHGEIRQSDGAQPLPYMALELVRGLPFGGLIDFRGKLTPRETASALAQVLDSLHEAHMIGIIHRDLKPNNLLILAPEDRWAAPQDDTPALTARIGVPPIEDPIWKDVSGLSVKVVDFGLGKMLEVGGRRVKRLTRTGVAAGTAEYMSPEQVRSQEDIDHRTDIYGVAMLMFRFLTGKPAYQGAMVDVAMKQVYEPLPPLPPPLNDHPISAVYQRAGSKERDQRYSSAAEMAWALRVVLDPSLAANKPEFTVPPPRQKARSFFRRLFGR